MKRSSNTHSEIRDRLCEDILSGNLPPGTPLRVATLAKRYGVGTMPIRSALQELRGRGLIIAEPNRSAFVRQVDAEFISNIYDLRHALWGIIIPRCVRFITNADIEELERIQDQMEAATAAGDMAEVRRQNRLYLFLVYRTARHPEACEVLDRNWVLINSLRATFGYGPGRLADTNRMHRAEIKALRARDGDTMLDLVRTSAERSRQDLTKLIGTEHAYVKKGTKGPRSKTAA